MAQFTSLINFLTAVSTSWHSATLLSGTLPPSFCMSAVISDIDLVMIFDSVAAMPAFSKDLLSGTSSCETLLCRTVSSSWVACAMLSLAVAKAGSWLIASMTYSAARMVRACVRKIPAAAPTACIALCMKIQSAPNFVAIFARCGPVEFIALLCNVPAAELMVSILSCSCCWAMGRVAPMESPSARAMVSHTNQAAWLRFWMSSAGWLIMCIKSHADSTTPSAIACA